MEKNLGLVPCFADGLLDGPDEGVSLRSRLGRLLGIADSVGESEPALLGSLDGSDEGPTLGALLGKLLGIADSVGGIDCSDEGPTLGSLLGRLLGIADGLSDGPDEGVSLGS